MSLETKGGNIRIVLLITAAIWTLLAAAAVAVVVFRAPLIFEIGGSPIFVSSTAWVLGIWVVGLVGLVLPLVTASRMRRGLWVLWWLTVLGSTAWTAVQLTSKSPTKERSWRRCIRCCGKIASISM